MMKTFVKKIIIFLLPIISVWAITECFYRIVPSNYTSKHENIIASYQEIETLILGDSHAFFGLDPEYLDAPSFNLSNISQSLYFDQLLFEKHKDSISNLKNVIITIGYYSLSQLKNTKEDTWRKYFYQHQMEVEVPVISPLDIRKYSVSLSRRFDKSVTLFHKYIREGTIVASDNTGWGTNYKDSNGSSLAIESKITAKKHEDFLLDFEENIQRLQSIINDCQKIGCKVYLVDMPVYDGYLSFLDPNKLQKITKTCVQLAKQDRVTYINLRQDVRLEETDLYDPDHLNHKGSKKYTKIINEIISSPKNQD